MSYLGQTPELQSGTYKKEEVDGLLATKQDTLVSGTNIKTVGGTSLVGSGDVQVQAPLVSGTNIKTVNGSSLLGSGNLQIQNELVSGTSIKTVGGTSLLGAGDVPVQSPLVSGTSIKTVGGTSLLGAGNINVVTSVNGASGSVTGLAPTNSPGLTGIPTAPTAASNTNTTQIATTAFVKTTVSSNGDAQIAYALAF